MGQIEKKKNYSNRESKRKAITWPDEFLDEGSQDFVQALAPGPINELRLVWTPTQPKSHNEVFLVVTKVTKSFTACQDTDLCMSEFNRRPEGMHLREENMALRNCLLNSRGSFTTGMNTSCDEWLQCMNKA